MSSEYRYQLPIKQGILVNRSTDWCRLCSRMCRIIKRHSGLVLVTRDMQNALRLQDEIRQFCDYQ